MILKKCHHHLHNRDNKSGSHARAIIAISIIKLMMRVMICINNNQSPNTLGQVPPNIDDINEAPPLYTYIQNKLSGYGWMIAGIIILAYSIWAFIANFQRALPLLIVECIIIAIVLFHWITDKYYAERKSNVQNQIIHFCMDTMEKSKIAVALCIILIAVLVGVLIEDLRMPKI